MLLRWEQVDTRHPWHEGRIEVISIRGRHFTHRRAVRVARYYNRLLRQPYGDRATYVLMVRDRRTGELESVEEGQ